MTIDAIISVPDRIIEKKIIVTRTKYKNKLVRIIKKSIICGKVKLEKTKTYYASSIHNLLLEISFRKRNESKIPKIYLLGSDVLQRITKRKCEVLEIEIILKVIPLSQFSMKLEVLQKLSEHELIRLSEAKKYFERSFNYNSIAEW